MVTVEEMKNAVGHNARITRVDYQTSIKNIEILD